MTSPAPAVFAARLLVASAAAALLALLASCVSEQPGYSPTQPTKIICGCHDGATCYEETAKLASKRGENADTAEELLYLAQCACFQKSMAGCNTLGHFAKDHIAACDRGDDVATSCTVAGFVYLHGMSVPKVSGRSYDHDNVLARAAFDKACKAASAPACRNMR
jgi:TPR repeat protein